MKRLLAAGIVAAGAGLSYALAQWLLRRASREPPPFPHVRDAGPEELEGVDETDWDIVDEQSDESFPASDPPGNY